MWTEEELDRILAICQRHNVLVVSDEIHQDIVIGDHPFVPAAVVGDGKYRDMVVTLNSASKTFEYLVLLDLRAYVKPEDMEEFVQKRCRLGVDYGQWFGKGYEGFIRLNLATDPALVRRAAQNIAAEAKQAAAT